MRKYLFSPTLITAFYLTGCISLPVQERHIIVETRNERAKIWEEAGGINRTSQPNHQKQQGEKDQETTTKKFRLFLEPFFKK